jgi:ElaB/YqjD/DUF883 family membrane-anchored ribosome-binding protein
MNTPFQTPDPSSAINSAAQSAEQAIRSSQRMANHTLDGLADQVESTRAAAGPVLDGWNAEAHHLTQRASDAIHQGAQQLKQQAQHMTSSTRGFIEHEPLKAVLIAVAAGAALMVLGSLIARGGRGGGH